MLKTTITIPVQKSIKNVQERFTDIGWMRSERETFKPFYTCVVYTYLVYRFIYTYITYVYCIIYLRCWPLGYWQSQNLSYPLLCPYSHATDFDVYTREQCKTSRCLLKVCSVYQLYVSLVDGYVCFVCMCKIIVLKLCTNDILSVTDGNNNRYV